MRHASEQGCRMIYGVARDPEHPPFRETGELTRALSMNDSGRDTLNALLCEKAYSFPDTAKGWYCRSNERDEILFRTLLNALEKAIPPTEAADLPEES